MGWDGRFAKNRPREDRIWMELWMSAYGTYVRGYELQAEMRAGLCFCRCGTRALLGAGWEIFSDGMAIVMTG